MSWQTWRNYNIYWITRHIITWTPVNCCLSVKRCGTWVAISSGWFRRSLHRCSECALNFEVADLFLHWNFLVGQSFLPLLLQIIELDQEVTGKLLISRLFVSILCGSDILLARLQKLSHAKILLLARKKCKQFSSIFIKQNGGIAVILEPLHEENVVVNPVCVLGLLLLPLHFFFFLESSEELERTFAYRRSFAKALSEDRVLQVKFGRYCFTRGGCLLLTLNKVL